MWAWAVPAYAQMTSTDAMVCRFCPDCHEPLPPREEHKCGSEAPEE